MNDLLMLATLLDGPKHGYALKKRAVLISGRRDLHNNVVYPLLKRFVSQGWVARRTTPGQRGQIREVYALTAEGKAELVRRLGEFGESEAREMEEFSLRVGLFSILASEKQGNILAQRDRWLAAHQEELTRIQQTISVGKWGEEVVRFMLKQAASERKWIAGLRRKNSRVEKTSTIRTVKGGCSE